MDLASWQGLLGVGMRVVLGVMLRGCGCGGREGVGVAEGSAERVGRGTCVLSV